MNPGGPLSLREVVDKHSAALLDELTAHIDSKIESHRVQAQVDLGAALQQAEAAHSEAWKQAEAEHSEAWKQAEAEHSEALTQAATQAATQAQRTREKAIADSRASTAESLNQAVRRIRSASDAIPTLTTLLECTAPWSLHAVVLRVENNQARSLAARGLEASEFSISRGDAAAIVSVCETRDPLVALISANELSPALADAFPEQSTGGKAYLLPIGARHEVVAVLIAAGDVVPAALELLCETAGMRIEALEQPAQVFAAPLKPLPNPELIHIVPAAVPETKSAATLSWSDLSADDQKLHLQAQRVARVKVAEMRLYHPDPLRKGVLESSIYSALGNEIDRARADFLKEFLSKSPTMVDYLHLEILRSLAHDDDRLLGPDYPGPMV